MIRTHRPARSHGLARTLCLALLALPALGLLPSPAAALDACLQNTDRTPLRRMWVEHFFTNVLTDEDGCFTLPGVSGKVDVRVFAQNPVVQMQDGKGLSFLNSVSQVVAVSDGGTFRIGAQGPFFSRAEEIRQAYEDGLSSFAPWGPEFPLGDARRDTPAIIRAVEDDAIPTQRSFVEPKSIPSGFPLIHYIPDVLGNGVLPHDTVTHELGHALHFAMLPPAKRERIQNDYLYWLAVDPEKSHDFAKRTMPMLAYLEAFGFFAADWEATAAAAGFWRGTRFEMALRTNAFFTTAANRGSDLLPSSGPILGDDVEGAVYMTLFHDFARAQGLAFAIEQFVSCESVDIQEFGHCIAQRHPGAVFQSLVTAGAAWGISFDAAAEPVADSAQSGEHFGHATASGDFDGDGHPDLAIGVPDELIGSVRSGAVNVLYGTADGLSSTDNQLWHMNVSGIPGSNSPGDRFGAALAAGDFDADGFDDLAIGVPSDRVGSTDDAGQVVVLFGSPRGLAATRALGLHQGTPGIIGGVEQGDQFGFALTTGDFDGDGRDDLAVGVAFEDIGSKIDAGGVNVVFGTPTGLGTRDQFFSQDSGGVLGVAEAFDNMGFALAAGDFDGDGRDDLAIGVPNEDKDLFTPDSGQVNVLYGAAGGLTASGDQQWHQDSSGIAEVREAFDNFGQALAVGDFDGDGHDDLAIGVPNEDLGITAMDAGVTQVLYGTPLGLDDLRDQRFHQNILVDVAEAFDNFGASLVAGDFDGNGRDDLAIGIPNEDLGALVDAGAVAVLYASDSDRLNTAGNEIWHQTLPGFEADPFPFDDFGRSLAAADFDGDGSAQLVIGVPGDDVDGVGGAGSVEVMASDASGLVSGNQNQRWHQNR